MNANVRFLLTVASAVALQMMGAARARAQATPVDSLVMALRSPDFGVRGAALQRITDTYSNPMPPRLVEAVLTLLGQEAATVASHDGDDDYGEYLMGLVIAGAQTGDRRATASLVRLGGLQVSGGVAGFIASQGAAVFPLLDSLLGSGEQEAYDAVEEFGLILGRHGSGLTRADSARILATLTSVASASPSLPHDAVALVAMRIPLPEFLAVVRALAAADPSLLEAPDAVRALTRLQASTSPVTLLGRLQVALEGACVGASGSRNGACQSLQNQLATAIQHLTAGRTQPARNVLAAFAGRGDAAWQQGALTAMEHHLFSDTARQIAGRL